MTETATERIEVFGVVQGVGFRPFVYRLAEKHGLSGRVGNDSSRVFIEVAGPPTSIDGLVQDLAREAPPLSRVERIERRPLAGGIGRGFTIVASEAGVGEATLIPPDTATCSDCLAELVDPDDRRYGHPFINCTNCGPRFTIIEALPYDRPATTMARFEMCAACRREYEDPRNRRYHAQPIGCPDCGSTLAYRSPEGATSRDPVAAAREDLTAGRIMAVKGLGGFRLACDATNDEAVARLRSLKSRPDKSFAVMVADRAAAERLARVSEAEGAELESIERPIVLLRARVGSGLSTLVAPANPLVGVMLAHTPVDHLLLSGLDRPLVMTSANRSGEPICYSDSEIESRVVPLCDSVLTNDRPIVTSCDDSVVRVVDGHLLPIRRARGYAPIPVPFGGDRRPVLAVGGELKNAFCLASGDHAWVSQHLGDMDNLSTLNEFERSLKRFESVYGVEPEAVVVDAHPGYHTTGWAKRNRQGLVVAVQHHHAHIASVMAEHGLAPDTSVIGFAFDGTGYGDDGAIWGGEVLVADGRAYERFAHLSYVPMPGGDSSIRQPFRSALAHLRSAGVPWDPSLAPVRCLDPEELARLGHQMDRGFGCVDSSSMGRLFDAVAALVGLRSEISFEAQAAIDLEAAAEGALGDQNGCSYSFGFADGVLDPGPVIRSIVADLDSGAEIGRIALGFHGAVSDAVVAVAEVIRCDRGLETVALSGGVFQNALLVSKCLDGLGRAGFTVLTNRLVPPNDGGLSLGQAYIGGWSTGREATNPPPSMWAPSSQGPSSPLDSNQVEEA